MHRIRARRYSIPRAGSRLFATPTITNPSYFAAIAPRSPTRLASSCRASAVGSPAIASSLYRSPITVPRSSPVPANSNPLIADLKPLLSAEDWSYLEIRPIDNSFDDVLQAAGFQRCDEYLLHRLQLDASADALFRQFHKSSVQYRVRRAERLGLVCEVGRSPKLIRDFFHLMAITRRRQGLPPQPYAWFENLARCMGEDGIDIRVAYKEQRPVAAVLNIKAFGHVCYKYSCSDLHFKSMNATCLLLWQTIQDACRDGAPGTRFGTFRNR